MYIGLWILKSMIKFTNMEMFWKIKDLNLLFESIVKYPNKKKYLILLIKNIVAQNIF